MNTSEDLGTSIISIRYKLIFIGDVAVGKTSIMTRIVTHEFKDKYDVKIKKYI
jgi:GTPase SAR1 family protein